jgi:hypothetical protein
VQTSRDVYVIMRCLEEKIDVEIKWLRSRAEGGCAGLGGEKQKGRDAVIDYIFPGARSARTNGREARVHICSFTQ